MILEMWPKKSFLLILLAIVFSCQTKEDKSAGIGSVNDLVLADSLILSLDERSTPEFNYHQIGDFLDQESFINLNLVNNSLDFYNLSEGEIIHRIQFASEGPDRITNVGGFYYHNEDSIFLLQKMTISNIKLIDIKGKITNQLSPILPLDLEIPGLINHFSTSLSPSYFFQNAIYFDQGILKNTSAPGVLGGDFRSSGRFDLNSDSVFLFPKSGFPHFYKDKALPIYLSISSRVLGKNNEWIYSWNALDSILVYDLNMNDRKAIYSKSKFKEKDIPNTPNASLEVELEVVISNTHYCKVLYDPYRKNYLRFVQIGRFFNPDQDNTIMSIFKNDFSIMLYDENWDFISESFFEGSKHNFYHAFIGQKGLYIPRTNPNFEGLDEDKVVFDIYDLL